MTWNPFKKDKAQEPVEEESPAKTVGKGRPTPKMKQAQARNLRPLVPPDRKASAKAAKERIRKREDEEYEAMRTGDINRMPKAERLPWRVYIRDYVDARRNLGEFFDPGCVRHAARLDSRHHHRAAAVGPDDDSAVRVPDCRDHRRMADVAQAQGQAHRQVRRTVRVQGLPLLLLRLEPFDSDASLEASQAALPEARSLAGRLMSIYTLAPLVEGLSRKENSPVDCF